MYKEDQFHLWKNLNDATSDKITDLINNKAYQFGVEKAIECCGGGTVSDYYRIQLEYFVLDLLEVLCKNYDLYEQKR